MVDYHHCTINVVNYCMHVYNFTCTYHSELQVYNVTVDPMCLDDDDTTVKKKPAKLVSPILQSCLLLSIVLFYLLCSCSVLFLNFQLQGSLVL